MRRRSMRSFKRALAMGGALTVVAASIATSSGAIAQSESAAAAGECNVGVSWNNFQQRRWAATDKPNMQATIEAGGGTFSDADADLDTEQQLTDVNTLIEQGADVLVILAQ